MARQKSRWTSTRRHRCGETGRATEGGGKDAFIGRDGSGQNGPHKFGTRWYSAILGDLRKAFQDVWCPRWDSNPCYRRERLPANHNCKITQAREAVGTHPQRNSEWQIGYPVGTTEIATLQTIRSREFLPEAHAV
jgi:hypothetical protein